MVRLSFILLVLLCVSTVVRAEDASYTLVDEVVAVVEGQAILRSDLSALQETLQRQGENIEDTRSLLERRVEDLLIAAHADTLGVRIGEKQIDDMVENIAQQNSMSPDQLYQAVAAQGLNIADYRRLLADQMLRMQIVQHEIEPMVSIDQADLIAYIKSHPEQYSKPPKVALRFLSQSDSYAGDVTAQLAERPEVEVAWQDLDEPLREWIVQQDRPGSIAQFKRSDGVLWVAFVRLYPAEPVALETVEEEVYEAVKRTKIERAFQFWLAELKADAWVERFVH